MYKALSIVPKNSEATSFIIYENRWMNSSKKKRSHRIQSIR